MMRFYVGSVLCVCALVLMLNAQEVVGEGVDREIRTASGPPMGHLLRFARQWRQRQLRDQNNGDHLMRFSRADVNDDHLLRFARDRGLDHFLRNARNDGHLLRFARSDDNEDDLDKRDSHLLRFA